MPTGLNVQYRGHHSSNTQPNTRHDITCGQTEMSFSIPMSDQMPLPQNASLSDPRCPVDTGGHALTGQTALNDCGTSVIFTDNLVIFSNLIILPSTNTNSNTSGESVIPIECRYNRTAELQLNYMSVLRQVLFTETGVGQFQFRIQQFRDASFSSPLSEAHYPLRLTSSETVFLQLSLGQFSQVGDSSYGMDVVRCTASPSPSPMLASRGQLKELINDGCSASSDVQLIDHTDASSSNATKDRFRFSFPAVTFPDPSRTASGLVYVHCRVQLCPANECTQPDQCSGASRVSRKRRSVTESRHVSAGPMLVELDTSDARSSASPLVIALGAIAATTTLVAMAVIVASSRARRGEGHQLLTVTNEQ